MDQANSAINHNTRSNADNSVSREVARVAAQWLVKLGGVDSTEQDKLDCQQWRDSHPEHELAWSRAQKLKANFNVLPVDLGMKVLKREQRYSRRKAINSLALLIATVPATYALYRTQPWRTWSADYHTVRGERLQFTLSDGSQISMNTNTLLDLEFSEQQRLLILRQGEVMINTGADLNSPLGQPRPFQVQTSQGQLKPIGTKFIVREYDDTQQTRLSVLEGTVDIYSLSKNKVQRVNSDEQTTFTTENIDPVEPLQAQADAWLNGVLMVKDMRLDEFLNELGRYHVGVLRSEPAVSSLRISGAFQLDNTRQILASLPAILPVSLHYLSSYWVTVRAK